MQYTVYSNSQCKPICIHSSSYKHMCVKPSLFWGFWQLSPCCGDFTKVGNPWNAKRLETEISSGRMRTDTLLLMRFNKSWTTWKNPCDSELTECLLSTLTHMHNCRWSIHKNPISGVLKGSHIQISESHTSHARNVPKRASHAFAAKCAQRVAEMPWLWLHCTPKAAEGDTTRDSIRWNS